jgi:chromosome segregation ATPase
MTESPGVYWKARAVKAEAECDRLREELDAEKERWISLHDAYSKMWAERDRLREENATLTRRAETAEIALRLSTTDADRLREERRRLCELWAEVDDISMRSDYLDEFRRLLEGEP